MTDVEQREAARQFANRWHNKGKEDEHGRSYWIDFLSKVMDMENVLERIDFEKKVVINGNTKKIDVYIPETRVLIEQKSLGIPLDKKLKNADDLYLTAFEQADRYNSKLTFDERARWIVTCNFGEIWIYDMNQKQPQPTIIRLDELPNKYFLLDFLVKKEVKKISDEVEVSIKAGDIVGLLYDAFLEQYNIPEETKNNKLTPEQQEKRKHKLQSLNALCVRLVFCLFAEDAGVFGKRNIFHDYLAAYEVRDCRKALIELFKILDTPYSERDDYLEEDLAQFPYVNGGLFADETIEIPPFTEEIKDLLLVKASENFNWSEISPTIFGAVFESTLNQDTRRKGGMHYTSIENIHKVIDPLFLDDLKEELVEIKNKSSAGGSRTKSLRNFQDKLASLKFFDPACGSGNFLTESYISLRRLENEVIRELDKDRLDGQMFLPFLDDNWLNVKVSIQQFYGIEINDFAVATSKTALWIAEAQMLSETKALADIGNDFLPLKTYTNITENNSLRVDWNDIVPRNELNYIIGNPPFIGARLMSNAQKDDIAHIFKGWKNIGNLDYVCCWYKKAADFIYSTKIKCALVSTNSITQGEQVAILWNPLMERGISIDFAHKTFRWDSEANSKAHVHCVIISFSSNKNNTQKKLFDGDNVRIVNNINGYLLDGKNIHVESRSTPIFDVPEIGIGNKPIDGGLYLFNEEEKNEFIKKEPLSEKWFKQWMGADEFIKRKKRYCLWLGDCTPNELRQMPECMKRIEAVKEYRLASRSAQTVKLAEKPTRFHVENMPSSNYLLIPRVSTERRRYIPIGYLSPDIICSDAVHIISNATLYHFGVLISNIHMAWMRAICGRLKSDYRYSKDIVYNNFPWCNPTPEQKERIEKAAQSILDARALYPDSSLADLYDPLTMPQELSKAHNDNNRAVMNAYGFTTKMTEEECVLALLEMYYEMK